MTRKKLDSGQYKDSSLSEVRFIATQLQQLADELNGIAVEAEQLGIDNIRVRGMKTFYETHLPQVKGTVSQFKAMFEHSKNLYAMKNFGVSQVAEEPVVPSPSEQAEQAVRKVRASRNRKSE